MSEIKQIIIKAARELLDEGFDIEELTIRQIASEAHIAVGLINYHFGNKSNLIREVISSIIEDEAKETLENQAKETDSPRQKLVKFLKAMTIMVVKYQKYSKILIEDELLSERFTTPETIVPYLKEIRPELEDSQIRVLAIQIVAPLQYMFLKGEALGRYLSKSDETITNEYYGDLVERVLKELQI